MGIDETILASAFEDAVDEPITEEDYTDVDDDEPVEDPEPEEEVVEDSEDEDTEADEAEEDEDAPWDFEAWERDSGRPDDLPPHALALYKKFQGSHTKKMQDLSMRERQLVGREQQVQALLEKAENFFKTQEAADDQQPAWPTEDMTPQQAQEQWQKIMQWNAKQVLPKQEKVEDKPFGPDEAIQHAMNHADWSQELDAAMAELVQSDPKWQSYLTSPSGIDALVDITKMQMEMKALQEKSAELESAKVRRAAGARKRKTPKARTKVQPVDTTSEALEGLEPMQKIGKIFELEKK